MSQATLTRPDIFTKIESEVRSYCRSWPVTFERAHGDTLYAEDGRGYLDFFCGAGALNYGHNPHVLRQPLVDYLLNDGVVHSLDMHTTAKRDFLIAFNDLILRPRDLDYRVMFPGPTGTNAVESALKLARKVSGREHVLSFTNAFHGMTLGSLSVTGNSMKRQGAGIPLTNSSKLPYDDYFAGAVEDFIWLEKVLEDSGSGVDKPAAIIVETVQGEGGLNAARAEWLRTLSELCQRHEIFLIVDDVQAGCGRTGTFFSFEEAGIVPDIVCLSKSISGYGLPMALMLARPGLDAHWEPGEHNGTFRGHNPAFVTGRVALETFWSDDELMQQVRARSAELRTALERIAATYGGTVRGRGLLTGIHFPDLSAAGRIAGVAFEHGLLVETSGPESEVLKIMPPLNITAERLAEGIAIIEAAVGEVLPPIA